MDDRSIPLLLLALFLCGLGLAAWWICRNKPQRQVTCDRCDENTPDRERRPPE